MGERPTHLTFPRARPFRPKYEVLPGQPERISAIDQVDEPGIRTVDGVLITEGALTGRCVPNGPSKLARPGVVLHPLVGDSEERGGPSKGGEDHDAKHEQPRRNTHPGCLCC